MSTIYGEALIGTLIGGVLAWVLAYGAYLEAAYWTERWRREQSEKETRRGLRADSGREGEGGWD